MLFAKVNGEKVEAKPKATAFCPLCDRKVFSKCGEINIWHWAHLNDEGCDNWYEPETEWHKNWKFTFGKEYCEIVISKEGVRHIADIQTKDGVVIELQNSPIQKPIVRRREKFYGERMLWIINGIPFKHNFQFLTSPLDRHEEYYRQHFYLQTEYGTIDKNTGKVTNDKNKDMTFSWNWPRKSWIEAQWYIFIDFGDEYLLWVNEGMGTNRVKGKKVTKEIFLRKYGGNLDLLPTLIAKSKD